MSRFQISNFNRPIEMAELKSLLMREDPTILELGAHNGSTTRQFLKAFGSAFVHCFECDPRPLKSLKRQLVFGKYYNTPMYAGQRNMEELFDMLGANWQPLANYEGYNFLAVNTNLRKA